MVAMAALAPAWLAVPPWWVSMAGGVAALLMLRAMPMGRSAAMGGKAPPGAPLVGEVLPVWRRQIDSARQQSEESISGILSSFSSIAQRLDQAVQMTQGGQAATPLHSADELVRRNEQAVEHMLQPMRRAMASRDAVYGKLDTMEQAMSDLRQLSTQIKQLARRTNMVALNASVEATRAGASGSGFAVVAMEVRQLAAQSGESADKMMARTGLIDQELQGLRLLAADDDASNEGLRDEARRGARAVIAGLLQSLGDMDRSSRELQETGVAVHQELEQVLMNFQMQDRLSQMLNCVTDDIQRLTQWLGQGGDLSAAQAGEWLARLDASYTMEEQRAEHHGNTSIQREAAVEFF
jgi:methyl-accepting chemotaxis protein